MVPAPRPGYIEGASAPCEGVNVLRITIEGLKHVIYRTPFAKYLAHRYQDCFTPAQLSFLLECVDRTASLPGPILEVGCFTGVTTVWLNKHLAATGIKKAYVAIDTFQGFLASDLRHEVKVRSKDGRPMRNAFRYNHRSWVAKALALNEVDNVTLIRADASHFDYSAYRDISFALIDVDLYLPVRSALQALFPVMAPGGVIVVDDCLADNMYDGALQAYREFTAAQGLPERIIHGKLGVIDVPHR